MATFEGITLLKEDDFSKTFKVDISGRSIVTTVAEDDTGIRNWVWYFRTYGERGMRVAVTTKMVKGRVAICSFFIDDKCLVVPLDRRKKISLVITEFLLVGFIFTGIRIRESIEALLKGLLLNREGVFLNEATGTFPTIVDLGSDLQRLSFSVLGYSPIYPPNVESNWEHQVAAATITGAVIYAVDEALAPPDLPVRPFTILADPPGPLQDMTIPIQNKRRRLESFTRTRPGTSTIVGEKEEVTAVVEKNVYADVYELEVLPYLPAKNLLTLKSVCKDWLQVITSSDFVRRHLSKGIQSRIRVLITKHHFSAIIEYTNYYKQTKKQIAYPPPFSRGTRVIGSADGLALLLNKSLIGLFNPSTGKFSELQLCPHPPMSFSELQFYPHPPKDMSLYFPWFGDLGGGEYALVLGICEAPVGFQTWVYKFTRGSNTMNLICSTKNTLRRYYKFLQGKATFVQGVVHWPVRFDQQRPLYYTCYTILAYHVGGNKHMEISPPSQCHFSIGLSVDGCSLLATSINLKCVAEIWIMKEDCWSKYATIGPANNFTRMDPLGFFPNGDLIMDVGKSRLMKYSFNYKEATLLMDYGKTGNSGVVMCADSLLSLDFT